MSAPKKSTRPKLRPKDLKSKRDVDNFDMESSDRTPPIIEFDDDYNDTAENPHTRNFRGGGMVKSKGYARGGRVMSKGMAKGGRVMSKGLKALKEERPDVVAQMGYRRVGRIMSKGGAKGGAKGGMIRLADVRDNSKRGRTY